MAPASMPSPASTATSRSSSSLRSTTARRRPPPPSRRTRRRSAYQLVSRPPHQRGRAGDAPHRRRRRADCHRAAARLRHLPGHGSRARHAAAPGITIISLEHGTPCCSGPTRWTAMASTAVEVRGRARRRRDGRGHVRRSRGRRRLRADRHRRQRAVPGVLRRQPPARPGRHDVVVPRHRQRPVRAPRRRRGRQRRRRVPCAEGAHDAVRTDPLQPAGRRLRRPHDRQCHRLLGAPPVGRRHRPGRGHGLDLAEAIPRRGRVRAVRVRRAGRRHAPGELHRPPRRHQGPGQQPGPQLRSERRRRRSGCAKATRRLHVAGRGAGLRHRPLRLRPTAPG